MNRVVDLKDKLLNYLGNKANGSTRTIPVDKLALAKNLEIDYDMFGSIVKELRSEGFLESISSDSISLTLDGVNLYESGGYSNLKTKLFFEGEESSIRQEENDRVRRLSIVKLENDLKEYKEKMKLELMSSQKEFFETSIEKNKLYFWISILSLIMSLGALFLSLSK